METKRGQAGFSLVELLVAVTIMLVLAGTVAVNLMRDPKKGKAASPADFNPFAPRPPVPVLKGKEMLAALKAAFIKERKR